MLRTIKNNDGKISKSELETEMVDYDLHTSRQIDYYSNCLKMFHLIKIDRWIIEITKYWNDILNLSIKDQAFELANKLFSDKIFYKSLHEWIDSLTIQEFEDKWWLLSKSTFNRRKQTIKSWITWVCDVFT
jgi:hypothetical protein